MPIQSRPAIAHTLVCLSYLYIALFNIVYILRPMAIASARSYGPCVCVCVFVREKETRRERERKCACCGSTTNNRDNVYGRAKIKITKPFYYRLISRPVFFSLVLSIFFYISYYMYIYIRA